MMAGQTAGNTTTMFIQLWLCGDAGTPGCGLRESLMPRASI